MDIAGFEDLVDRHGGDPKRWPMPDRGEAEALLAVSPAARAVLAAVREVEGVLRTPVPAAPSGAIDRIAARATRRPQETRARRLAVRAGLGTTAAAVLALGVLAGSLLGPAPAHDASADGVLAAALDSGGAGDVE